MAQLFNENQTEFRPNHVDLQSEVPKSDRLLVLSDKKMGCGSTPSGFPGLEIFRQPVGQGHLKMNPVIFVTHMMYPGLIM